MRPKNRIYCRECGRQKIVFETEKKAKRFIDFNGEEIAKETGRKPVRVYYCECCGGYHVTSSQHERKHYNRVEDVIEKYRREFE